jgi:AP-1 complex subunit beta-1
VRLFSVLHQINMLTRCYHYSLDEVSTAKALQTVVAGQQAENLLDFDDTPATEGTPVGLAATTASIKSTKAGANLLTSSNPLDDLVSIFGSTSVSPFPATNFGASSPPPMFGAGLGGVSSPVAAQPTAKPQTQQDDDLLGLF